jgi:hypothetical protein
MFLDNVKEDNEQQEVILFVVVVDVDSPDDVHDQIFQSNHHHIVHKDIY